MRAVPLQTRALEALDRAQDRNGSPLVFPGERGGYLDIHHFRPFQWRPAQKVAGITPMRRIYDLRHTFATFALRAGISTASFNATPWAGCPTDCTPGRRRLHVRPRFPADLAGSWG